MNLATKATFANPQPHLKELSIKRSDFLGDGMKVAYRGKCAVIYILSIFLTSCSGKFQYLETLKYLFAVVRKFLYYASSSIWFFIDLCSSPAVLCSVFFSSRITVSEARCVGIQTRVAGWSDRTRRDINASFVFITGNSLTREITCAAFQ